MSEIDTKNKAASKEHFEALMLPHMDALYRYAFSFTREGARAEDLVQDAYLKAFKAFHQFKEGSNAKAWLFKILRNTFISDYRRKKAHPEVSVSDEDAEFRIYNAAKEIHDQRELSEAEQEMFDPKNLEKFFGDEIIKAVDSLSEDYREVILLCDVQEFSYQEISDLLDIPIGTVRSRIARARGLLQKQLWEYAKDRGLWSKSG